MYSVTARKLSIVSRSESNRSYLGKASLAGINLHNFEIKRKNICFLKNEKSI